MEMHLSKPYAISGNGRVDERIIHACSLVVHVFCGVELQVGFPKFHVDQFVMYGLVIHLQKHVLHNRK